MEKQESSLDNIPVDKLVERFENKVAEATLNGSGERGVQLFSIGKGELRWKQRTLEPIPPEMNERQKEIYNALRKSQRVEVEIKPFAYAEFWIVGKPK